jgi:hypothetical protein
LGLDELGERAELAGTSDPTSTQIKVELFTSDVDLFCHHATSGMIRGLEDCDFITFFKEHFGCGEASNACSNDDYT